MMDHMAVLDDHPLVDYFQREMDYLRARGIEFSRDHPKVAMELQLSRDDRRIRMWNY